MHDSSTRLPCSLAVVASVSPDSILVFAGLSGMPTPAACDRMRLACSASSSSSAMITLAKLPKPVLRAGVGDRNESRGHEETGCQEVSDGTEEQA